MGFVSFNDEAEQYLCAAVLRPGNVNAAVGAVGILRRLLMMVRHFFPGRAHSRSPRWRLCESRSARLSDAEPILSMSCSGQQCGVARKAEEAVQYAA